jgi:glycosyltransferase involved in cell wall biosynthesis
VSYAQKSISDGPVMRENMKQEFPGITLVTPSFNQGQFLEEAILSIIGQGYPSLEYFVVDGGSTDGSIDVIRKYADRITWWVSEKDGGQSAGLIKGFSRARGDVLGWINSDDLLEKGALEAVGRAYRCKGFDGLVASNVILFSETRKRQRLLRPRDLNSEDLIKIWTRKAYFSQPGVFFPRRAYEEVGGLDPNLQYGMDYDLVIRLLRVCPVLYLDQVLARAREHPASKTCAESGYAAAVCCAVARRYLKEIEGGNSRIAQWLLRRYILRLAGGRVYHGAPAAIWPLLKELVAAVDIPRGYSVTSK